MVFRRPPPPPLLGALWHKFALPLASVPLYSVSKMPFDLGEGPFNCQFLLLFSLMSMIAYSEDADDLSDSEVVATFLLSNTSHIWLRGLQFSLAESMEQCFDALKNSGLPISAEPSEDGMPWCNATWDTVLCWPAIPGGQSVSLRCPPLKGLDTTKSITKFCHPSGQWMGKTEDDFSRPHGWTNFTMCFTQEVVAIMQNMDNGTLLMAQEVAKNVRKLEFVGLGLSLISLFFSVAIFSFFRRLRVFRNLIHLHLMVALLAVVLIRLVLYIDLIFTDRMGHQQLVNPHGKTINTMVFVCELMFFLLEYFKSVAFWWMFLEGLYLHNLLVFAFFNKTPKLWPYLITAYGVPLAHTFCWLIVLLVKKHGQLERCLGSYYLETEFWILDGPRLLQLVVGLTLTVLIVTLNAFFIFNVIRVLWLKVRDSQQSSSEIGRMKKSVKAALMLIPLLGIPNIMQTIPFSPTQENITYFAIWTYCASLSYMYQGFMIAIIYCFTNREVQSVLHNCYTRHRLSHSRMAHRSSRYAPMASPYTQIKNNSGSLGANVAVIVGEIKVIEGNGTVANAGDCLLLPSHSNGTSPCISEMGAESCGTESLSNANDSGRTLPGISDHGGRTMPEAMPCQS